MTSGNTVGTATARAHTNIALVKYWGKADEDLIIPTNDSVSLTLDSFYTTTTVTFDDMLEADDIIFDAQLARGKASQRITAFLDIVRQRAGFPYFAHVSTQNNVPTAAGLASSASGFAALAGAAAKAARLPIDGPYLSRLARRGSGSAARSIFGGFARWHAGDSDLTSVAVTIDTGQMPGTDAEWDIRVISAVVAKGEKKVGSREGMRLSMLTSPYFSAWVRTAGLDADTMEHAIVEHDFHAVGRIAESNALRMHATTLSANPAFTYFSPDTLRIMDTVRDLRESGIPCYFTIDAGPNVKVVCEEPHVLAILDALGAVNGAENLTTCRPGPGLNFVYDRHG